jgi:diacylglycerol kinase family enzyme
LSRAGIDCDVTPTEFAGHAAQMGEQLAPGAYETVLCIGGDGTVHEFVNGVLRREQSQRDEVLSSTNFATLPAGTQNALAVSIRTASVLSAAHCLITRSTVRLDALKVTSVHAHPLWGQINEGAPLYSLCANLWGLGGDIAAESERYRWMMTGRYAFLKVRYWRVVVSCCQLARYGC